MSQIVFVQFLEMSNTTHSPPGRKVTLCIQLLVDYRALEEILQERRSILQQPIANYRSRDQRDNIKRFSFFPDSS
jgi:hypothetical protein